MVHREDDQGLLRLRADDLPATIGGRQAAVAVSGVADDAALAYLGLSDGDLFVQPADDSGRVRCNGTVLHTSTWLDTHDVLRIDGASGACQGKISVESIGNEIVLRIERAADGPASSSEIVPLRIVASSPESKPRHFVLPADFQPTDIGQGARSRALPRLRVVLAWLFAAVLLGTVGLLFAARSIELRIEPVPESLTIEGRVPGPRIGGRYLLLPGRYTVVAERQGYRRLEAPIEVSRDSNQTFDLALELLPGLLTVEANVDGANVSVDGQSRGSMPFGAIELQAGEHTVAIVAEGYRPYQGTVIVEGGGVAQSLSAELVARWGTVTVRSRPAGADVRVDGKELGVTPVTAELLEGRHQVELRRSGYEPQTQTLKVTANQTVELPVVRLYLVAGRLELDSSPAGATVSVDGEFRGQTPLTLSLRPGRKHEIALTRVGHGSETRTVELDSGERQQLLVELAARMGQLEVRAAPVDAEIWIDGKLRGVANQTLQLSVQAHEIEIRRQGYRSYRHRVVPRPGFPQTLTATLETEEEARERLRPEKIRTHLGQELELIGPARFTMGASRREPGRRANESLHQVEITRLFYVATKEVSNREFLEFNSEHSSGTSGGVSLELAEHPVVGVTLLSKTAL